MPSFCIMCYPPFPKDTPVIMLTANAISGAREKYLAEGFKDFLAKPIFPEQLEEMIQHYLPEKLKLFQIRCNNNGNFKRTDV